MDDTQSCAPAPSTAASFLGSSIQKHLKEALHGLHIDIANTNAELLTNMSHKMGEMCEAVTQTNHRILAQQEVQTTMMVELLSVLRSLEAKLDTLLPSSSSIPTPTPPTDPSASTILFTMSDPTTSTPVHVTLDEPFIPPSASTPLHIPTGSPPREDPVLQPVLQPTSPKPQPSPSSSDTIEEIEVLDSPPHPPPQHFPLFVPDPQDPIPVPALNLPEPISSDSPTFTTPEGDTLDTSSPIRATPVSFIRPSSQPPLDPLRSKPSSPIAPTLSDDVKKGEKD